MSCCKKLHAFCRARHVHESDGAVCTPLHLRKDAEIQEYNKKGPGPSTLFGRFSNKKSKNNMNKNNSGNNNNNNKNNNSSNSNKDFAALVTGSLRSQCFLRAGPRTLEDLGTLLERPQNPAM